MALGLEAGAVTLAEVRAWADTQIAEQTIPEGTLIELALVKKIPEALEYLHELGIGADPKASARLAIGHLYRALERNVVTPQQVAQALERMAMNGYVPDDLAECEMASFDDQLSVGFDDPDKIRYWMVSFLRRYAT